MTLLLALLLAQDPHPLKHRVIATWDSAICEDDPAGKSFLAEYKDLVDWMSKHEYNGLVVWGFLDARHGGEAAAKDLARYAKSKGVALSPGLGAPLCYAKPENRESLRKVVAGLLEAADVDGVHLETADESLTCGCAEHLSVCGPIVADVLRPRRVTYAAGRLGRDVLSLLPETCVPVRDDGSKPGLARIKAEGWSAHLRRREGRGFNPKLDDLRAFAGRASGGEGFVVGRGSSPKSPDAELGYLALIDFTRDAALTTEAFLKRHVPRLYGEGAAEDVVKLVLAQPAVHEKAAPYIKAYGGEWPAGDAKEVAALVNAQLALAKAAAMKASADGKRRLDAIAQVLDEARAICEAAAAGISDKAKLAEAYEKAGLPDDLYGYRKWK
jgi:hypothetical protein